ncbi:MAG TPA: CBS domain-containing protein [Bacteriovoracaceae bacterium]|nr:CBS domain-containing protein [Bacteriovoracaceae bacterium]
MLAKECMTKDVELGSPNMSLTEAAKKMKEGDFGMLPVREGDRLVGMITDRDIAIRAVAEGKDPNKVQVGEVMTSKVLYCFEDQNVHDVIKNLGQNKVRRLPVLNRDKRLVGILSLGNIVHSDADANVVDEALQQISQ